ncbi:6323_t:CDS:2, partial [Scutellospora calospora]
MSKQEFAGSRFFRGGSDTESEDEIISSGEELTDEEEEEISEESSSEDEEKKKQSKFLRDHASNEEDSSADEKRQVRSAKDKRLEAIESCIKVIENAQKINDWVVIQNEFDKLNKIISKGPQAIPRLYIKTIALLEDFLNEALKKEKDSKKKMNATQARALNSMKQKIKKNNRLYEEDIEKWRQTDEDIEDEVVSKSKGIKPSFDEDSQSDVSPTLDDEFITVGGGKGIKPIEEYTSENLFKKLREIMEARGKK